MSNEYEETQKEINKLLYETSQIKKHKKYQDMKKDKDFYNKMKKIAQFTLKLEKL